MCSIPNKWYLISLLTIFLLKRHVLTCKRVKNLENDSCNLSFDFVMLVWFMHRYKNKSICRCISFNYGVTLLQRELNKGESSLSNGMTIANEFFCELFCTVQMLVATTYDNIKVTIYCFKNIHFISKKQIQENREKV